MLAFLVIEIALLDVVTDLASGVVAGELFRLEGEGFLFAVELTLLAGELPLLVMLLLCEGELPRLNPALPGELPLLLMLLTEGEGDQPRAGELPLAEGEDPRRNVLVGGPPVTAFEAINGRLPRVPVLARLPGEELTVDALVSVGEELFTAPTALAAVAMVALVAELDLDIDGELDRMGRRGEPDDFVVDVDLGEDEPLELYDAVVGLGLFDEVLNAGRGLLDVEIGSGRGLLDVLALDLSGLSLSLLMGLAFRLGATTAAGSTTLSVLCYNGMKIKVLERGVLPEWSQACRSVVYRDEEE